MQILAISGSTRRQSTNTALLCALRDLAPSGVDIVVFDRLVSLPVFSPDLEGTRTPAAVRAFVRAVDACDGIVVSSPEYVRSIPGGLKNAIDWLVSGEAIVAKPIALAHASHRGDDLLAALRIVLGTVSHNFNPGLMLRVPLMKRTADEIAGVVGTPENRAKMSRFLDEFTRFCRELQPRKQ